MVAAALTGTAFVGQVPGVHAVATDPERASTDITVVGVEVDDVLNIRSGPGTANGIVGLKPTYGRARPGSYLALVNSFGVVEIARAEESAADGLGCERGAPVVVYDS